MIISSPTVKIVTVGAVPVPANPSVPCLATVAPFKPAVAVISPVVARVLLNVAAPVTSTLPIISPTPSAKLKSASLVVTLCLPIL